MSPRILLVDDVDEVRSSLCAMLARRYDVVQARDARDAIAAFAAQGPFPVVVTDYGMPGMDGLGLLAEVHRHAPETVGILFTGLADLDLAVRAVHEHGVFRFLTKPCGFEPLVRAIDEALEHHATLVDDELDRDELSFSKAALEGFTRTLEERVEGQTRGLRQLQCFSAELCTATSLEEVVRCCARSVHAALASRSVLVQAWDESARGVVDASLGGEMSGVMHREPMQTAHGNIGEIVVDLRTKSGLGLTETERALLASIAASTAVAAQHELRRRERDQTQHATILALARLAEQRDGETGKHLERVAAYCRLIATGLREDGCHQALLTDGWVHDLERSSALHDIGKVGIPDSILLKPGKLTPEEWEIMKTHVDIGADTLASVIAQFGGTRFLEMGRDIAWCHHEKWDGSGYPRALRAEEIPLCARILALADVYDALTSVRPYKPAWSHAEAVDWIRLRGGTHFDPDVLRVFLGRIEHVDEIRRRLADTPRDAHERALDLARRTG